MVRVGGVAGAGGWSGCLDAGTHTTEGDVFTARWRAEGRGAHSDRGAVGGGKVGVRGAGGRRRRPG